MRTWSGSRTPAMMSTSPGSNLSQCSMVYVWAAAAVMGGTSPRTYLRSAQGLQSRRCVVIDVIIQHRVCVSQDRARSLESLSPVRGRWRLLCCFICALLLGEGCSGGLGDEFHCQDADA